jgi:hypothetical protein
MIYFDKLDNQIKPGKLIKRLDRIGNNSRGNGKKHFYSYWIVEKINDEICLVKVDSNIRKNPKIRIVRQLVNKNQILERYEIL